MKQTESREGIYVIYAEKSIERIKAVLNSGLTPYRIAKEVGYAGANPVHDLISGKSDINRMGIGTAMKFEKLFEELVLKMEKIKELIEKVEKFEVELVGTDPDYHEKEYADGAAEHFIIYKVDVEMENDEDLEVFFSEHNWVKELREQVYAGEKDENDFIVAIEDLNELADQYNYDKVVAFRLDSGQIEWI